MEDYTIIIFKKQYRGQALQWLEKLDFLVSPSIPVLQIVLGLADFHC